MKYTYTIISCCITPILLIGVVFLMGGGHGTYSATNLLFPWGMIGTTFQNKISDIFVFLGIIQYPIYGLLMDTFKDTDLFEKVVLTILSLHFLLFILIFNFSKFH